MRWIARIVSRQVALLIDENRELREKLYKTNMELVRARTAVSILESVIDQNNLNKSDSQLVSNGE